MVPVIATILVVLLIGSVFYLKGEAHSEKNQARIILEHINLPDFKADKIYTPSFGGMTVGLDSKNHKVCFINSMRQPIFYNYSQITACDLEENGSSIVESGTENLSFQEVLPSDPSSPDYVSTIDLVVFVDDNFTPPYKINFLTVKVIKGSIDYYKIYTEAENWYRIFLEIIRMSRQDTSTLVNNNLSVIDELKNLKKLLAAGSITTEEFNIQKARLLN